MISLIIGLGNIGKRYQKTRHNLGFDVIDLAVKKTKAKILPSAPDYESYKMKSDDLEVFLAKPSTMMNGSGEAVIQLLENLELSPSEMLVIIDDFNIPLGTIRIRQGGSAGGHNGLDSIVAELQSENFPRLRLGIGPLPEKADVVDFVLEEFNKSERKKIDKMIEIGAEAVIFAAGHRFEEAMSKFNHNPV